MINGQCFSCYDHAMFQYFGQTKEFNPAKIQSDYIKSLEENGTKVECVSCCRKVEYVKEGDKWKEVVAND